MTTEEKLIQALVPQWYASRAWAEELLCRAFNLSVANEILAWPGKGLAHAIPGSNWTYCVHGVGVAIDRGIRCGGIDFDFDKPDPDPYRLQDYAERQLNAGNLPSDFRYLLDADFGTLARKVLSP